MPARRLSALIPILTLAVSVGGPLLAEEDCIWVEGENPINQTGTKHSWYNSVKKNMLSGGDWFSNFGPTEAVPEYAVTVPKDGTYAFWVRANPVANPKLSYRLESGDWKAIDLSKNQGNTNIASNDQPDMRFIAWTKADDLPLKAGKLRISFRMDSANQNHGGLDCFVLSLAPFIPNGSSKPGQKLGLANPGNWAFEPDSDPFDAKKALFDLRPLNEAVAGMNGYVTAGPDGDFKDGKGAPIRFWCVNTTVQEGPVDILRLHARHLAKRGVNMIRHHGHLNPDPKDPIDRVNTANIDALQKAVATMKEEGIYTTFSPFWATSHAGAQWKLTGGAGEMFTMVFWDETLQQAYKGWLKEALTRPNPYAKDKTPLAKDPALAIFQIQNEDSFLFWTTLGIVGNNPKKMAALQTKFDAWLQQKGLPAAKLNFRFWELANAGAEQKATMRFVTELMYNWNKEVERYLHEDLGCKALVNAGNWRTADQVKLLDLERWSYTANEVIGVNRYVGGAHVNPKTAHEAGYLVKGGDFYEDISCLTDPLHLATNARQVAGMPYIISESTWVPPVSHQSEGPFLVAAYSSLNGMDSYYWFALGKATWDDTIGKWGAATPTLMGGWPAAAFAFRKNLIKRGAPAVHEERAMDDLWDLRNPVLAEDAGFDPNRDSGISPRSSVKATVSPLAYLVGPVEVKYGGDPTKSTVADLKKYIDEGKKTVKSNTGELELDYGKGVATINAPGVQGASGYLAKFGDVKLSTVSISAKNDYATVMVVALDGKPLADSGKVLVQTTTTARPYNFKETLGVAFTSNDGKQKFTGNRIEDTGTPPWNVVNTDVTVGVANGKLKKATLLDANFYPIEDLKPQMSGGKLTIALPPQAMYVILQ